MSTMHERGRQTDRQRKGDNINRNRWNVLPVMSPNNETSHQIDSSRTYTKQRNTLYVQLKQYQTKQQQQQQTSL